MKDTLQLQDLIKLWKIGRDRTRRILRIFEAMGLNVALLTPKHGWVAERQAALEVIRNGKLKEALEIVRKEDAKKRYREEQKRIKESQKQIA